MTWALRFWPYALAAAIASALGWSGAWYVQGLHIASVRQELVEFQQGMVRAVQAAREFENVRNVEAQNAWAKNLDELRRTWRAGWVPQLPAESGGRGLSVPPASGVDASCREPVELARRLAAELGETTLQLNAIQERIEAQNGY